MNYLIEVLIVEDSESDALLLLRELKERHYTPLFERVQTREEFSAALRRKAWDVIICDYVLPQFSGPEALQLFRALGLDLPFLVVSGVYGEEKAVEMMKSGANDYILKGNLSRLVPALERELEAAQERRLRRRAEGAVQYLAAIVESSQDAIYGKNLDGQIASWNPAAERMFGYKPQEIIGQSTVVLFPSDRRNELFELIANIRRGEIVTVADTLRLHKNGQAVPVSVTVSPIKNSMGEVIGASSIARDIRPQKQAEQDRRLLDQKLAAVSHEVQTLTGMLPICAACKRIRDDEGYWEQVETYLAKHSEILFSHSLCPQCAADYERQLAGNEK